MRYKHSAVGNLSVSIYKLNVEYRSLDRAIAQSCCKVFILIEKVFAIIRSVHSIHHIFQRAVTICLPIL